MSGRSGAGKSASGKPLTAEESAALNARIHAALDAIAASCSNLPGAVDTASTYAAATGCSVGLDLYDRTAARLAAAGQVTPAEIAAGRAQVLPVRGPMDPVPV